jgi:excisionase family DNA binding protein
VRTFPVLVDVTTVAKLLSVDVRFVRRLVSERRIPYLKLGTHLRFDVAEVVPWLDEHRVRARTEATARTGAHDGTGVGRAT